MVELTIRLGDWLKNFGQPVQLAIDSLSWDWPWIKEIFSAPETWPENVERKPEILDQDTELNQAIERAFASGLCRHHSFDDAKANRLGWLVHSISYISTHTSQSLHRCFNGIYWNRRSVERPHGHNCIL